MFEKVHHGVLILAMFEKVCLGVTCSVCHIDEGFENNFFFLISQLRCP